MTNKTFVPMGLVELTKQVADSARANIKSKRKQVDDLEDRLHSSMDAKRDVASNYVEQLDSIAEKEVEVRNDPMTDLISNVNKNMQLWNKAIADSYKTGYDDGFKAGSLTSTEPTSEQRDRDLLESHGIDVDGFCDQMVKLVKDHETGSTTSHEQDIDEDEPDQYPDNYGGTK